MKGILAMFLEILGILAVVLYLGFNFVTAKTHSAKEMKAKFITGQCVVGAILTNIFYIPAWALKLIRSIVVATVK